MERENCELLFEYLRSILYDQKIEKPDLDHLDEPYKKLGLGLEYLQQAVEEMLDAHTLPYATLILPSI